MKNHELENTKRLFDSLDKVVEEPLETLRKKYPDEIQLMHSEEYVDLTKTMAATIVNGINPTIQSEHYERRKMEPTRISGVTMLGLPTINVPLPVVIFVVGFFLLAIYHGVTT